MKDFEKTLVAGAVTALFSAAIVIFCLISRFQLPLVFFLCGSIYVLQGIMLGPLLGSFFALLTGLIVLFVSYWVFGFWDDYSALNIFTGTMAALLAGWWVSLRQNSTSISVFFAAFLGNAAMMALRTAGGETVHDISLFRDVMIAAAVLVPAIAVLVRLGLDRFSTST